MAVRVTLVHNPDAGDERYSGKRLVAELEKAGYEARLVSARKQELSEGLEDPGRLVVVAGGDGSVKRVAVALTGRAVPMAILPIGTANNLAKSLGVMGTIGDLVRGWKRAGRRRIQVGTVTAWRRTMRFVESVGVGVFTGLVVRDEPEADEDVAGLTGHAVDRALQLLLRIVEEHPAVSRRLTLDGSDLSGEYLLVEAMNIPRIGPNVLLAPDADCGDDRLELVTVSEAERPMFADYLRARLAGDAAPLELPVRRGSRVTLQATPGELHVDSDPWKPDSAGGSANRDPFEGEVSIGLEGGGVEVLVPPEA